MYNTKQQDSALRSDLRSIIKEDPQSIRAEIAQRALNNSNIEDFFHDLLTHTSISKMTRFFAYDVDAQNFIDRHSDEIKERRFQIEKEIGESVSFYDIFQKFVTWHIVIETTKEIFKKLKNNHCQQISLFS